MRQPERRSRVLGLGFLAVTHLLIDMHSGMLPVILIYQREALRLSLAQVGAVAGIYNFGISLGQPLFGHLSDRFGELRFALGGLLWVALLGATLGVAQSFGILVLLAGLAALGPAAFHPSGAARASRILFSGRGTAMSVFIAGGSVGHAVGPILAGLVLGAVGLTGTLWIGVGALALWFLISLLSFFLRFPEIRQQSEGAAKHPFVSPAWSVVVALALITGLRTWVHMSLSTYIPQFVTATGSSPALASGLLSLFLGGATLGISLGGPLADRFGHRQVITAAMLALTPILLVLPQSAGWGLMPTAFLGGFLVGLPLPLTIVLGQSLFSRGTGLASGMVFGASFVSGAAGVALTGLIADQWGLGTALLLLGILPFIAAIAGWVLPKGEPTPPSEAIPSFTV